MTLTVGSWNVWIHGPRDAKAVASLINQQGIDIIGIQEAGIYVDRDFEQNTAQKIAGHLGFQHVFYPAFDVRKERGYILGNAVLSRFPIIDSETHALNPPHVVYDGTPATEPRILVGAQISYDDSSFWFFTTHLQFSVRFATTPMRLAQVERVLAVTGEAQGPVVLTGDFNVPTESQEVKRVEEKFVRVGGEEPTFANKPFDYHGWKVSGLAHRIDHIFLSKDIACKETSTIQSSLSDHLPIKAVIEVP